MDGQEEPRVFPGNPTVVLRPGPDRGGGSVPDGREEVNRTMPMSSLKAGSPRGKSGKNLSARFSLEVFRKKGADLTGKQEMIDEYFGKNLTRYVNLPIDNSSKLSLDSIPKLDNKYENLEVFNEGGQGIISAARENALGRIVALKTLRSEFSDQKNSGVGDFITEAKVTAQLDHPSIIPIYAIGRDNEDHLQLAMKLINGKTLREHLKNICLNYRMRGISRFDERASLFKRLELFLHVCDALVYAHHRRIMHCDLKPENIMIGEYMDVYLMDWGLAKPIPDRNPDPEWIRPETVAGTPRYLSPEAIVGERFDERSDIFAMGLILQEITTLQYAVSGEDSSEVMNKIKDGLLNPVSHQFGFRIDRDLTAIIHKATAYYREERYQSIRELAEDLRSYLQGNEVSANPDSTITKAVRWMTHHRTTMVLIVMLALAVALGAVAFSVYQTLQHTRLMSERNEMVNSAFGKCFAATSLLDREILAQEKNINLLALLVSRILSGQGGHNENQLFQLYGSDGRLPSPPDAVYSSWYQTKVSFSEGVCFAVPGNDMKNVKRKMLQLSPIVPIMRETILDSSSKLTFLSPGETDRFRQAIQEGHPVKSIYIALKEGIQFGFPWRDIYKPGFDPRKRPWYIRGKDAVRPAWGMPYVGSDYRMGLCLPCSMRIQNENGSFYGVAGLDLTFDKVVEILQKSGNTGYFVMDSALINNRGRIIASSEKKRRTGRFSRKEADENQEAAVELFSTPKIRYEILKQKYGIITDFEPGRGEVIYLFSQMKTLNWICVQKIDFYAYQGFFRKNKLMEMAMARSAKVPKHKYQVPRIRR